MGIKTMDSNYFYIKPISFFQENESKINTLMVEFFNEWESNLLFDALIFLCNSIEDEIRVRERYKGILWWNRKNVSDLTALKSLLTEVQSMHKLDNLHWMKPLFIEEFMPKVMEYESNKFFYSGIYKNDYPSVISFNSTIEYTTKHMVEHWMAYKGDDVSVCIPHDALIDYILNGLVVEEL